MTYTFGNADIRIKNGYILFNAFLSLQIIFYWNFSLIAFLRIFLKLNTGHCETSPLVSFIAS
jgi:hypothetical protein